MITEYYAMELNSLNSVFGRLWSEYSGQVLLQSKSLAFSKMKEKMPLVFL